jgi:hypothetical protein
MSDRDPIESQAGVETRQIDNKYALMFNIPELYYYLSKNNNEILKGFRQCDSKLFN